MKNKDIFEITFSCPDWAIRKYSPIVPASEYFPTEYLNLPVGQIAPFDQQKIHSQLSARQCPAITNYMNSGYILKSWCDIEISFNHNRINLQMSNLDYGYEIHTENQFQKLLGDQFSVRTVFKFNNPWSISTSEGYGCYWFPYFYHNKNYQALPAAVDTDLMLNRNPINIAFFKKENTLIKLGDPLVHIIPYKKTSIKGLSKSYDESDHKKFLNYLNLNKLSRYGWRKFIKNKLKYTLEVRDLDNK